MKFFAIFNGFKISKYMYEMPAFTTLEARKIFAWSARGGGGGL
jgi:hypothetical protein